MPAPPRPRPSLGHWPGVEGRRGAALARLTPCCKPSSLTTLRSQVNVRPASSADGPPDSPDPPTPCCRACCSSSPPARSADEPSGTRAHLLPGRRPRVARPGALDRRAERRGGDPAVRQPGPVRRRGGGSGPGSPTRWESDSTGARATPSTSGPAPRSTTAGRSAPRDVRASILRALDPGDQGGPTVAALSHPGRARSTPRARRRAVRGHRGAGRLHHRLHPDRAAQHLSQVPRDAGRRRRADADAARLRPGVRSAAGPGGSCPGRTTTRSSSPGTPATGRGPRKRTPSASASSPRR